MLRKTYAKVDLGIIAENIRVLKRYAGTELMAVVKANAYGHGMLEVSKTCEKEGIRWFAVATPDEAELLREHTDKKILILSYPGFHGPVEEMIEKEISFAAFTPEQMEDAILSSRKAGKKALIHIKVDSGMGRIGLTTAEEMEELLDMIEANPDELMLEGVFTHFANSDETDKSFAYEQLKRFENMVSLVRKRGFSPLVHASNSAAILEMKEAHLDMCRMGIVLYGCAPSDEVGIEGTGLRPALSLHSFISHKKVIHKGDTVSYGRHFTAEKDETVITVPIGYADGYMRILSGNTFGIVNGHKVQQIGNICMDQMMFLATGIECEIGDEIKLICDEIDAAELARRVKTIDYEILTNISSRIPRVYVNAD